MWQIIFNLIEQEDAPTMVEYGLMIALIALVAVAGIAAFGQAVAPLFTIPAGAL